MISIAQGMDQFFVVIILRNLSFPYMFNGENIEVISKNKRNLMIDKWFLVFTF